MSDYGYCPSCGEPGVHRARGGLVTCMGGHRFSEVDFVDRAAARTPVREQLVESYFVQRVKETGGTVRKVRWDGHPGAPDRLVGWPGRHALVELKRPDGEPEPHQRREHDRLRAIGFRVDVIDTKEKVDAFVREMTGCS